MTRETLTIREAADVLGIGLSSAYEAARRGELPVLRIGRRMLIPKIAVERMLAESAIIADTIDDRMSNRD